MRLSQKNSYNRKLYTSVPGIIWTKKFSSCSSSYYWQCWENPGENQADPALASDDPDTTA